MKQPKMLIEHGLIPGHTLTPDEPGMENSASIIPDDQKMNPNCVCPTRTCPLHGFCQYCAQHHAELNRALEAMGLGEHCHFIIANRTAWWSGTAWRLPPRWHGR